MVKMSGGIKNGKTDCLKDSTKNCLRKAIILEGKNEKTEFNEDTRTNFEQYG